MFGPKTDIEPARELGARAPMPETELIPLSVLAWDLPEPSGGWRLELERRAITIVEDDIGLSSITRSDARMLIAERRESEAQQARKRAEVERRMEEADQLRQAQIWKGVPAGMIPDGVHPATAMLHAAKDARPRRRSVLEHALSNSGEITFTPLQSSPDGE